MTRLERSIQDEQEAVSAMVCRYLDSSRHCMGLATTTLSRKQLFGKVEGGTTDQIRVSPRYARESFGAGLDEHNQNHLLKLIRMSYHSVFPASSSTHLTAQQTKSTTILVAHVSSLFSHSMLNPKQSGLIHVTCLRDQPLDIEPESSINPCLSSLFFHHSFSSQHL